VNIEIGGCFSLFLGGGFFGGVFLFFFFFFVGLGFLFFVSSLSVLCCWCFFCFLCVFVLWFFGLLVFFVFFFGGFFLVCYFAPLFLFFFWGWGFGFFFFFFLVFGVWFVPPPSHDASTAFPKSQNSCHPIFSGPPRPFPTLKNSPRPQLV